MARTHQITIDGKSFRAESGELLLDAALKNGVELPFDCRAGHCGTCRVRLLSGTVHGGEGSEPGVVHACQCRIAGAAVIEQGQAEAVRSVEGVLALLRPLSREVVEIGIRTARPLLHRPGQYARLEFNGYPSRPYSITLPLDSRPADDIAWFHIRRVDDGRVSASLGRRIGPGHRLTLTGPFGSAYFRPSCVGRIILVATNTGFAPVWAIAVAALRENPSRRMMIIAGGRALESLYMAPALVQLARFENVLVVPVCSAEHLSAGAVHPGRPTDYLPKLLPTDVLYACGAPAMVEAVKSIAAGIGAVCYADPFLPADDSARPNAAGTRAIERVAAPVRRRIHEIAFDRSSGLQRG